MRRRDFIKFFGGTALWPLSAGAQQPERMRLIGILLPAAVGDPIFQDRLAAFQQELARLGWTVGRNVRIDTRLGHDQSCRDSQTRCGIGRARA
jgi:hypothetical protein